MLCHWKLPFHASLSRRLCRVSDAQRQRRAIRQYDLQKTTHWPTVLDWPQRDGHVVADFEALLAEALRQDVPPTLGLDGPVHQLTIRARGLESQETMRIAPEPFRDRSLDGDF